jgi:adenosylcobinamide-GDP ribazoletransferase
VLGAALWWPWGAAALLPAALVLLLAARFILGRIGGMTGDCYGAINELVEVALLLIIIGVQTVAGGG